MRERGERIGMQEGGGGGDESVNKRKQKESPSPCMTKDSKTHRACVHPEPPTV